MPKDALSLVLPIVRVLRWNAAIYSLLCVLAAIGTLMFWPANGPDNMDKIVGLSGFLAVLVASAVLYVFNFRAFGTMNAGPVLIWSNVALVILVCLIAAVEWRDRTLWLIDAGFLAGNTAILAFTRVDGVRDRRPA
ncbi:MAG: hypothetical protein Q8N10_01485 [Phenylobacterium sp.]|uniref:hypothetical protein n=1 Tax=Phenylobacterium sp. TaxID=1871053 RepID=UPI0027208497|nr:hypothetical protein [Phenylobacterium sp.]MDO8912766.1 hypothetical protein [Phenylobacterium sp.]MDP3099153.1 hypothetical protein [Phenylobacterium sp.]HQT53148.1 hypothetical protein [Phenylobacterium sp.]